MAERKRTWIIVGVVVAVVALAAVSAVFVWRAMNPPLPAPAQAVESVLELRRDRSTDASAYAAYFAEVEVAHTLAQDASTTAEASASAESTAGVQSPIPPWEPPYVSSQASRTADVVVIWKSDRRFDKWPGATVFNLKRMSGLWKIIDAQELTSTPPPELGSRESTKAP